MATENNIELVIKIPEKMLEDCKVRNTGHYSMYDFSSVIANGTLLEKGHGRIIDESKITKCDQVGIIIKDGTVTRVMVTDAPTIIESCLYKNWTKNKAKDKSSEVSK